MSQLFVQHWIACLEATVEPPVAVNNFYNLLRVGHTHGIPQESAFPLALPRTDVFARFIGGTGSVEFEIRVVWLDAPTRPRRAETYGPFRIAFRPDEPLRDWVFRLQHLPLSGPGRYRLDLRELRRGRAKLLAVEYFYVVQV